MFSAFLTGLAFMSLRSLLPPSFSSKNRIQSGPMHTEKHWRRLNGAALLPQVIQGVIFIDGLKEKAARSSVIPQGHSC